jgi:hypothetical protein
MEIFSACFLQLRRDKTAEADPNQQRSRLNQEFSEKIYRAFRRLLALLSTVGQGRTFIPRFREGLPEKTLQLQN